jgi:uncharacterized linocin/CFP29 family protein
MNNYLNRDDSPFDQNLWRYLDEMVSTIARGQLNARRLLYTGNPTGLDSQFIMGGAEKRIENDVEIVVPRGNFLTQLSTRFEISSRDIAMFMKTGIQFDMASLLKSVMNVSEQEDLLLFYGSEQSGVKGLINSDGIHKIPASPWKQVGDIISMVLSGIDVLDKAGFRGPYALGLSPQLYNKLFTKYPQADILEMDHMKTLVTDGVLKINFLHQGGILMMSNKEFQSIILGQDLMAGFEGASGRDYIFTLSETIALKVNVPESIVLFEMS